MKLRTLAVLLLAGIWGVGSWWWYTCKIKGFCAPERTADQTATPLATAAGSGLAATSAPPTEQPEAAAVTDTAGGATPETAEAAENTDRNTTAAGAGETADTAKSAATPADEANTGSDTDSDNDGLPDSREKALGLNPEQADSDGDGLHDRHELGPIASRPLDTDDDGMINALDDDDDGDGDPTREEGADPDGNGDPSDARDSDADGIPDYLDADSNWASLDDDGDGYSNGEEQQLGTNPALTDSDGDGVPDSIELENHRDTDGDGIIDALDTDDDGDGIITAMEGPDPNGDGLTNDAEDMDNNGVPDYLQAGLEDSRPDDDKATRPETAATPDNGDKPADADTDTAASLTADQPATDNADNTADTAGTDTGKTAADRQDEDKVTADTGDKPRTRGSIRSARLYFPFRSSEPDLADSAAEYFEEVISYLKANPHRKIRLTGHTDSVGRQAANHRLGRERAGEIRDMLVKRGAAADQIEIDSKGEDEPIADNQ
ncbi:MAG TPA: OmpA family protein, partial [Thiolinea sp.]|nr:OmpA family protein [Thiolinea sp.]